MLRAIYIDYPLSNSIYSENKKTRNFMSPTITYLEDKEEEVMTSYEDLDFVVDGCDSFSETADVIDGFVNLDPSFNTSLMASSSSLQTAALAPLDAYDPKTNHRVKLSQLTGENSEGIAQKLRQWLYECMSYIHNLVTRFREWHKEKGEVDAIQIEGNPEIEDAEFIEQVLGGYNNEADESNEEVAHDKCEDSVEASGVVNPESEDDSD
ncbi:uncharacterized protein [Euphorbia lathyris]|uniref:uncharacterized protein isoform X2 n=1 Tax=Euphorbia lathyris TaxID=212925 RepID=UPI0033138CC9